MLKAWLLAYNILSGADAASTHWAINHGAHEIVLTQNPWANDAIIGSVSTGVTYTMLKLDKRDHGMAMATTIVITAIRGAIVAHDLHVNGQLQRK